MNITTLTLHHIRNHGTTTIEPARRVNVFCGMNGHGKTSILEAISLCALSTTFVPSDDKSLIRRGEESCSAALTAYTDLETPYKVSVHISTKERKRISSSLGKRLSPQDIIGELPLVALSPDFKAITAGAPADRRRFMDSILAQSSKLYMGDMLTLKKILKQRNSLLHDAKSGHRIDEVLLETWTEALIKTSAAIVRKRMEFLREFSGYVQTAYQHIAHSHSGGMNEGVELLYETDALAEALTGMPNTALTQEQLERQIPTLAEIEQHYHRALQMARLQERKRGTTAHGPQKDELVLRVGGGVARESASQGQHKTLLIALKTAEFQYLRDVRVETPVLLLDDIFSELDARRAANVFALLESGAQTFVTTTDPELYHSHFAHNNADHALFMVEQGALHPVSSL